jgi:hypothetical protein
LWKRERRKQYLIADNIAGCIVLVEYVFNLYVKRKVFPFVYACPQPEDGISRLVNSIAMIYGTALRLTFYIQ